MSEEIIFVDGFNAKKIGDDFWSLSFNVEKFTDFMSAYKTENGYVNINICKSKKDENKYYGKLNTWTPPKKEENIKEVFEGEYLGNDEIPF